MQNSLQQTCIKLAILRSVIVLWIIVMVGPVFYAKSEPNGVPGFGVLFIGWLVLDILSWSSNFAVYFSAVFFFFNTYKTAAVIAVNAIILMLPFLRTDSLHTGESGNDKQQIDSLRYGHSVWVLSAFDLLTGGILLQAIKKNKTIR